MIDPLPKPYSIYSGYAILHSGFSSVGPHIKPLILKPIKVGISLQNAYAYVLFRSLIQRVHIKKSIPILVLGT